MAGMAARRTVLRVVMAMTIVLGATRNARSQGLISILDDVIAISSKGQSNKQQARAHQHLNVVGKEDALPGRPGSDYPRLGEQAPGRAPQGVISNAASRRGARYASMPSQIAPHKTSFTEPELWSGPLEFPDVGDDGPDDGLTLDAAIDQLVRANYDLQTKFHELPKADADILSAGLRLNPFVFTSADSLPYQPYSPSRPGASNYEVTIAQPVDVNRKRNHRIRVAQQARGVLEAQYQDAVRLKIDLLYTAFVDVLESRLALRAAQDGRKRLGDVLPVADLLPTADDALAAEVDRALIRISDADIAVIAAEAAYQQSKQDLATLLAIPVEQADELDVRGAIYVGAPPLPEVEGLIAIALSVRPDLLAYRLGVQRSNAAVQLARAERFEDVFLFYTPYTHQNNGPIGGQNASSWSIGVLVGVPIFDRNQGNIRRAVASAHQTSIELSGRERQIASEVQRAFGDYECSLDVVRQYEEKILPAARRLLDERKRRFSTAAEGLEAFLAAQMEHDKIVRRYAEHVIRCRRRMLRLNTAVGQRVVP